MSASLVSAKAQVDQPEVSVAGAEVHSRVHVSDSCNCFKFFVPSCMRKEKKRERSETDTRVAATASTALYDDRSDRNELPASLTRARQPNDLVRSPASDDLGSRVSQTQSVTVNVSCSHHSSPAATPVQPMPIVEGIRPDDDSSETSAKGI